MKFTDRDSSPGRLAESMPHTMSEDRAILESIFAENRTALADATKMRPSHSDNPSTPSETSPELEPGAHGRNLSAATGVESISVPDVLPPSKRAGDKSVDGEEPSSLARRFSKRNGLKIHKSILDTRAEEIEAALRGRWLKSGVYGNIVMPMIREKTECVPTSPAPLATVSNQPENAASSPSPRSRGSGLAAMKTSVGESLGRAFGRISLGKQSKKENKKSDELPASSLEDTSV